MALAPIFDFLTKLEKNNNRPWFEKHKDEYITARQTLETLMGKVIEKMGEVDPELGMLDAKKSIFRIYRDVRFSKDKTPYKTNMSAFLKHGGRKSGLAGYYLSLKPGEIFVAAGLWQPEAKNLAMIRQEIDYNGSELKKIFQKPAFKKVFGKMEGSKLKRPPKGYDEDNEFIDWLKHKDFLVTGKLSETELSKDFVRTVVKHFRLMHPFNQFLNTALLDQ